MFCFLVMLVKWLLYIVHVLHLFRTYVKGANLRTEPKFVVFMSQLMLLFQFCPSCKSCDPLVETSQHGTMVVVQTSCGNPQCLQKESVWHSQPNIQGTKMAAGNFLLSFAILLAGASASKVIRVFSHMGLACTSLRTIFNHQKVKNISNNSIFKTHYLGSQ